MHLRGPTDRHGGHALASDEGAYVPVGVCAVCVCLFVSDLFFRQSRMACSVFQSKSQCRSHD